MGYLAPIFLKICGDRFIAAVTQQRYSSRAAAAEAALGV
jgi:hypothetical protein